jgi:hypothetical protein
MLLINPPGEKPATDVREAPLLKQAGEYADAAENARLSGDTVASLALAIHAAQLLKLYRLLTGRKGNNR